MSAAGPGAWTPRLAAICRTAAAAPAYAGCAEQLRAVADAEGFRRLPFSSKETFRHDFRSFLTGAGAVRLHCTSGSTGQPALVLYSPEAIESITERAAITMRLAGVGGGDRVLNLFGYGTFIAGNLYDWGATRLGCCVIPFGSAAMTPPSFSEHAVRSLEPRVVNGVPSYLVRHLGDLRRAGVAGVDAIRVVQCAGEVLTPGLRRRLQAVLHDDAGVFDQYGMTEFGPLAAECRAGDGLHLLEHGLHFEVVDPAGAPVTAGSGELVVTSLDNQAMPLIRYRTGDRVELLGGACACGAASPRVRVLHRTGDLTKVRGVLCSKHDMVDAVRSVDGVDQFKIVIFGDAEQVDRLAVIATLTDGGDPERIRDALRSTFKDRMRLGPDRIDLVDHLQVPRTVSGKPLYVLDERHVMEDQLAS